MHDGTHPVAIPAETALAAARAHDTARCASCGHWRAMHPGDQGCTAPICRNRCGGWKPKE